MDKEQKKLLPRKKRIALVAHDHKKLDLVDWAYYNRDELGKHQLIATGTTGTVLQEKLGIEVIKLFSGPLGGDQQLGALIAEGEIDMIIFFWDPMEMQPHDSDVKALIRLAVAWNIIIACDRTTADFILTSSLMNHDYYAQIPDYSSYLKRKIS
jgi:methylglyoxal synthase